MSFSYFSWINNGLGFGLTHLGNLLFAVTFKRKLHSIGDQPSSQQTRLLSQIKRYPSPNFIFLISGFTFLGFFQLLWLFSVVPNVYSLHIMIIMLVSFIGILVPKYSISQDPILKSYISVYHYQPPPVLPWQLPDNFDQSSVKLITVKLKYE